MEHEDTGMKVSSGMAINAAEGIICDVTVNTLK